MPRSGELNAGGNAQVNAVSCSSAGNCTAGGYYTDGSSRRQAFVVSERFGRWGEAIEVPGSAVLNAGGAAQVNSVSCTSAGNCAAGGDYTTGSSRVQVFVVSQRDGRWGKAIEVPGSAALNVGGDAALDALSCPSAGNCAAVGLYADRRHRPDHFQAFVVRERNGRWGKAIEVPGSAVLNAGGFAEARSVSCPSAGNCAAGGEYTDVSGHFQAFVVSERNGRWGKAIEVPGSAALNAGGDAGVSTVSCPSAGNCAAGGGYTDGGSLNQVFVVGERNGRWGKAIEVPGSAVLNAAGFAHLISVSCPSAGNCAAGGFYADTFDNPQAFVDTERNGRWGKAIEVPGSAALNAGGFAEIMSVSCPSAGNCAVGGVYQDGASRNQAFVDTERNGRWGKAIEVPGV